ncbi:MAG: hypothetical protein AAFR28_03545 [Pseudomonadota bacterium]
MNIHDETDYSRALGDFGLDREPICYLRLTAKGDASIEATERMCSDRFRRTEDIAYNVTLEWRFGASDSDAEVADPNEIARIAQAVAPLLQRVHAGHSVEHDRENHVGRLTDDAAKASREIREILDEAHVWRTDAEVWRADEWLGDAHGITADTTDAELPERVQDWLAMAKEKDAYFTDRDLIATARDIRDDIRSQEAD